LNLGVVGQLGRNFCAAAWRYSGSTRQSVVTCSANIDVAIAAVERKRSQPTSCLTADAIYYSIAAVHSLQNNSLDAVTAPDCLSELYTIKHLVVEKMH